MLSDGINLYARATYPNSSGQKMYPTLWRAIGPPLRKPTEWAGFCGCTRSSTYINYLIVAGETGDPSVLLVSFPHSALLYGGPLAPLSENLRNGQVFAAAQYPVSI